MPAVVLKIGGLHTDPSAIAPPRGAMRVAQDVLLHRPGAVQPRPGLGDQTGVGSHSSYTDVYSIMPYGGTILMHVDGSGVSAIRTKAGANIEATDDLLPWDTNHSGRNAWFAMRESLYLSTTTGIRKVESTSATSAPLAGANTNFHPTTYWPVAQTSGEVAITANSQVAYQYVWAREDANGYVRRSPPSDRLRIQSASAVVVVFDRFYIPATAEAGDVFELYRTTNSGGLNTAPGEDYFLVAREPITTGDITAGYIDRGVITDAVADVDLGAALYTSNSQLGVAAAKYPPPMAKCCASWGNVAWYGNTQGLHSVTARLVNVWLDTAAFTIHDLLGWYQESYTSGNASFVDTDETVSVTGSAPKGVRVGQRIWESSTPGGPASPDAAGDAIPANTLIDSITTKITIDAGNVGDGDTTVIFGQTFTWRASPSGDYEIDIGVDADTSAANLESRIDYFNDTIGWVTLLGVEVTTAASTTSATVSVSTSEGYGVHVTETGGNQTISWEMEMSNAATATGDSSTYPFYIGDYLTVDDTLFYGGRSVSGRKLTKSGADASAQTDQYFFVDVASTDDGDRRVTLAASIADAVNTFAIAGDGANMRARVLEQEQSGADVVDDTEITFIRHTPDGGSFTVYCSAPRAFDVNLQGAAGNGVDSVTATAEGRVYYSALDEPEAVPLGNFFDVGERTEPVRALAPLQRALIVFKDDGIYAITGSGPHGWVVEELDLSSRILTPDAYCVLNNICFAWTDKGVLPVTEVAVGEPISAPIASTLRQYQAVYAKAVTGGKRGVYMVAHSRLQLVILAVSTSTSATNSDTWFVWSLATGLWQEWTRDDIIAAYDPSVEGLATVGSLASTVQVYYERTDEDAAASYYDRTKTGTGLSPASNRVVWPQADFDGEVPKVGDVAEFTDAHRITAVSVDGSDYLIDFAETPVGSTATWYQSIVGTCEWQALTLPATYTRWIEAHLQLLDGATGFDAITSAQPTVGGRVEGASTADTIAITANVSATRSAIEKVGVPRNLVRAKHFYPEIVFTEAGILWRFGEPQFWAEPGSVRVSR